MLRALLLGFALVSCAGPPAPFVGSLPATPEGEQPERWAADIAQIVRAPREPNRPVLFYGSSSIRLWKSLAVDMAPLPVVNGGFGGSRLFDAVYWAELVLASTNPRAIVVFSGTNDIAGGSPRSADWLAERFEELVRRVRGLGCQAPLFYLAITPSPARVEHLEIVHRANRLIAEHCARDASLHFVDSGSGVLDAAGQPAAKWFVEDGLHLNQDGYAHWTKTLRPVLFRELGEPLN